MTRFLKSLVIGAFIALVLVIFEGTSRHAALTANAARSHLSVTSTLIGGFLGVTVVSTIIAFVLFSLFGIRRRPAPAQRPWQGSYPGQGPWQGQRRGI